MPLKDKRTGEYLSEEKLNFSIRENEHLRSRLDNMRHDSGSSMIMGKLAKEKFTDKIIALDLGNGYILELDTHADMNIIKEALGNLANSP